MATVLHSWQILVAAMAGWITRQQDAVIEYLREENRVLKEQLARKRLRLTDARYYPRLREDGAELYYQTSKQIFAVPLTWTPSPRPGRPSVQFDTDVTNPLGYDVSKDGKQFYIVELDEEKWRSERVDFVLNWFDELKERVSE